MLWFATFLRLKKNAFCDVIGEELSRVICYFGDSIQDYLRDLKDMHMTKKCILVGLTRRIARPSMNEGVNFSRNCLTALLGE